MYKRHNDPTGRGFGVQLGLAILAGAATGCVNDLLEFDPGDRVESESLEGPENAELLVRSAIGDFECAFVQYIATTSQVTDEMDNSNLASTEAFQLDRRSVNKERTHYALFPCGTLEGLLTPIQTARFQADGILTKLEGWTDDEVNPSDPARRTALIATAAAYAGYAYLLLGEGFCTATADAGPELTQAEVFALAEERFTRALAAVGTAGDDEIRNLALVGRARARLNLGRGADAVTDARLVSEGFEHFATTSGASSRAYNSIYQFNGVGALITVGPDYLGLTFAGVPDPRVPVIDAGTAGSDQATPLRLQKKYTSLDQPIRMASYTEAQLIIAEVAGGTEAVDIINALHDAAGLPHFTGNDPAAILTQVIQERSREFFLESQHFFDVARLNLELNPAPGTLYPKGGSYGDMRCFPLPDVERDNNPNA